MAADPWLLKDKNEQINEKDENKFVKFEDNFKPYEKLPDSAFYISSLELKLSKLQGKQGDVKTSDLVHSLESTRDQHMRDFLSNSDHVSPTDFDSEVSNERFLSPSNVVMRKLRPEKQALSAEELKNLIIADELAKIAAELKEAIAAAADEKEEEDTEIKF